jgi:Holliday junction resolvasome RuvABC endonuclease subunit
MPEFRILSLDTAVANTGHAIFRFNRRTDNSSIVIGTEVSFLHGGTIETESCTDTDSRVRKTIDAIDALCNVHQINFVVTEAPEIIYLHRFQKSKQQQGSVIHGLIKVAGTAYAVVAYCHVKNLFCRTVTPSEWQKFTKEQKKDSKGTSLLLAQAALDHLKSTKRLLKKDEHLADAINIGVHAILNLSSGNWASPRL